MKPIKKLTGVITSHKDLSLTAREVTLKLSEPIDFVSGSFVNIFIEKDGEKLRRAFSIASPEGITDTITLAIRLNLSGKVTPLFWQENVVGTKVEVMGPLGLNTADKMQSKNVYLFGYGIGAGVVKSLADHFVHKPDLQSLNIMTGSRNEKEILYIDYFDNLVLNLKNTHTYYVVSNPDSNTVHKTGYIQHHLEHFDFNDSVVYVCGQEEACDDLVEKVKKQQPSNCQFFIEGFH
jgi:NAD(P)H-flavin reductase